MMDEIIEVLLDIVLDGSIELSTNKKVPKWIRYLLIVFLALFFGAVVIGLFVLGALFMREQVFVGMFFILVSLVFIVFGIRKFREMYVEKKDSKK